MLDTLKKVTEETLQEIEEEKRVRKTKEIFLLFSMGSQFDHLIKQMLEKIGVFCMVADPKSITAEDVKKVGPVGIVSSGGPASVHTDPPPFDDFIFDLGIPVLGICLGFQMWAKHVGAPVVSAGKREFNVHALSITDTTAELFHGCDHVTPVLQSHGDIIEPNHVFKELASTENSPVAAGHYKHLWGVQFHPEVTETIQGRQMFENFCFKICGAKDRYPAGKEAERKISELREKIGDKNVLMALSGGSDSSTTIYLLKEAMKSSRGKIRAVYIKGVDRPDDEEYVKKYFGNQDWVDLKIVDATEDFLVALKGKFAMKEKRRAMKGIYHDILSRETKLFGAKFIAQGTLYTDISESGGGYQSGAVKAVIKEHHNVNHEWGDSIEG